MLLQQSSEEKQTTEDVGKMHPIVDKHTEDVTFDFQQCSESYG
jgi:hypothetical protein